MVLCRQEQHLEEVIVMKKALVFAGVILLSPIIMAVVDALVGVSFKEEVTLFAWDRPRWDPHAVGSYITRVRPVVVAAADYVPK